MKVRRCLALTKRALKQFRHDRRTLAFVLFMPLLMIIIFGYTFSGDVNNVKVVIVNMDHRATINTTDLSNVVKQKQVNVSMANMVIDKLDTDVLSIQPTPKNEGMARQQVKDGIVWAAIIFPTNYSEEFLHGTLEINVRFPSISFNTIARGIVCVYIDGSNPNIAGAIIKEVNTAMMSAVEQFASNNNLTMRKPAIELSQDYAYGSSSLKFINYFAPGVMAFAVMMVTTIITIIVFVQERSTGTLNRLLVSPATEGEIVVGYALAFGLIGMAQSIVVLAAAIGFFSITVVGNVLLAFLIVVLLGFGHQGLGIMLSAAAKNELQAIQFIPLILFPSILLAGLFWPVESIPAMLRPFSGIIPLSYAIDAMRSVMIRGWGPDRIWLDLTALAIFALVMLGSATLLLKKKRG